MMNPTTPNPLRPIVVLSLCPLSFSFSFVMFITSFILNPLQDRYVRGIHRGREVIQVNPAPVFRPQQVVVNDGMVPRFRELNSVPVAPVMET